jgi:hypothetical protein
MQQNYRLTEELPAVSFMTREDTGTKFFPNVTDQAFFTKLKTHYVKVMFIPLSDCL